MISNYYFAIIHRLILILLEIFSKYNLAERAKLQDGYHFCHPYLDG